MQNVRSIRLLTIVIIVMYTLTGCISTILSNDKEVVNTKTYQDSIAVNADIELNDSISEVKIPYDTNDNLNPLKVKTSTNTNIIPLIYDGLVKIDPAYKLEYKLAANILKDDENKVKIILNANKKFSDGSIVSSKDIVYSINKIKASDTIYSKNLENIMSAQALDHLTIEIITKSPDNLIEYQLDFPIIKEDTGNDKIPIGYGRYILDQQTNTLKYNKNYFESDVPLIKTIKLQSIPQKELIITSIKTGELSAGYIEPSEDYEVTGVTTKNTIIPQNNLVYIGINQDIKELSSTKFRTAISWAIDRSELLLKAYNNKGVPTSIPINPALLNSKQIKFKNYDKSNKTIANNLLNELEYKNKDKYGYRYSNKNISENNDILTIEILVNEESNEKLLAAYTIRDMLKSIGIKVNIKKLEFKHYLDKINNGDYQLYIGEVKLTNNMNLDSLMKLTKLSNKFDISPKIFKLYNDSKKNYNNLYQFIEVFSEETPFVPLIFKYNLIYYSNCFKNPPITSYNDIYYNIHEWN